METLNSNSKEYKNKIAETLLIRLKTGMIIGITESREKSYSVEDLLKMIDILKNKPESVKELFEETILYALKHKMQNSQHKNKTQILFVIEEIEDLNKVLDENRKMIEKYPDDDALKLSYENLLVRKEELVKELKELF